MIDVTMPKRTKRVRLIVVNYSARTLQDGLRLPLRRSKVKTFCKEIGSDGWRVVECHLFEPKTQNEKNRAQQILPGRKEIES